VCCLFCVNEVFFLILFINLYLLLYITLDRILNKDQAGMN
jgi:hypothetical protein